MTPREIALWIDGAGQRLRREHNARAWAAHTTAALTRAKKMPKLDTLLAKEPKKAKRRQTWQEQAAIMERWFKAQNAQLERLGRGTSG